MDYESKREAAADGAALAGFLPITRQWFSEAFGRPTPGQEAAWPAIAQGGHVLAVAPTGSGKTLAAFLLALDRLYAEGPAEGTRILYISPLKALGVDVWRNLQLPLQGMAELGGRLGLALPELRVGVRSGDTTAAERARLARRPPDILITTPESLYLLLTSRARAGLARVRTVIVDEVHALVGNKRGAHLALSLERLDELLAGPAQRIGLSATVRPLDLALDFLGGAAPVQLINPPFSRSLDMRIVVPVADMADLPVPLAGAGASGERTGRAGSIWFHVEESILDRILACRSTIVFVNSRGLAEKLCARLNELYAERLSGQAQSPTVVPELYESATGQRGAGLTPLLARAHHGSVAKATRQDIERELKNGELRCVVATSSLELGIDMGQVEQVIQVAPPPSVGSALQRVGRSGHRAGAVSRGLIYPRTRRELVDAAVCLERVQAGEIENLRLPCNPLDILAQHSVAMAVGQPLTAERWYGIVRRAAPFRSLPRGAFDATLAMLAGRYPAQDFAQFRPRLVWDRDSDLLSARPGAQALAVQSGGVIPDRGAFRVVLAGDGGGRLVGELDEEMVYESRVNDVIMLGAGAWRIQEIRRDQVLVVPAPGRSARLPFWHGDSPARPAELGRAIGAFLRGLDQEPPEQSRARLGNLGLDANAVANLLNLLAEQKAATRVLPTDKCLVLERCRDENGDWRLILHSPYGRLVHAPWALALAGRFQELFQTDPVWSANDDGLVGRLPDRCGPWPGPELLRFDPAEIQDTVKTCLGRSALFSARFRECASRALVLPRSRPGRRSPLWQQRLRSAQLLEVASRYPDFPVLVEAARECLQDVYDLPALARVLADLASGEISLVQVETERPSPFAANLLFGYVGEHLYALDAPLAERRSEILALDPALLADLLGQTSLDHLLDPALLARTGAELQRLASGWQAKGREGVIDLLRELGPLSTQEVAERLVPDQGSGLPGQPLATAWAWLDELRAAGRVMPTRLAEEKGWAVLEDADALNRLAALDSGLEASLRSALAVSPTGSNPLLGLVGRYARSHLPFTGVQLAARFGLGQPALLDPLLAALQARGQLIKVDGGQIVPGAGEPAWVDQEVFRRLRARSLQAARAAARPVEQAAYVRLLLEHQRVLPDKRPRQDSEGAELEAAIGQLAGLALPASLWESRILPARLADYAPAGLDQALASGLLLWAGHGRLGRTDGLVSLHWRDWAAETLPPASPDRLTLLQEAVMEQLAGGGAYFAVQIAAKIAEQGGDPPNPEDLEQAIWALAWSGRISSDSWAGLRAWRQSRAVRPAKAVPRRRNGRLYRPYDYGRGPLAGQIQTGPSLAGRWFALPEADAAGAVLAKAESLLERYGVVGRAVALAEGFPWQSRVFRALEDSGRLVRGHFVQGLGPVQYATGVTVNRLRELAAAAPEQAALALAAADPANPWGLILPWPIGRGRIKPDRRPGALVIIGSGRLKLWLAQGGRSLLSFFAEDEPEAERLAAVRSLAQALAQAPDLTIESIDGENPLRSPLAEPLAAAGFSELPKGLGWYGTGRAAG